MNTFHHQPTVGTKLQGKIATNEFKDVKEIYLKLVGDVHIRVGEYSRSISLVDDTIGLFNAEMANNPAPLDERANQFEYSFNFSDSLPPSYRDRRDEDSVDVEYALVLCTEYRKLFKKTRKQKIPFNLVKSSSNPIELGDINVIRNSVMHNKANISVEVHAPNSPIIPANKPLPLNIALTLTSKQLLEEFDLTLHFTRLTKLRTRRWHDFQCIEKVLLTLHKADMVYQHTDFHSSQVTHHYSVSLTMSDVSDFEYKDLLSISHYVSLCYNSTQLVAFDAPLMQPSMPSSNAPPPYSDRPGQLHPL